MPNWSGTLLTTKGRALQAKVEAGTAMTITKLKIGDGTMGSGQTVDSLTDLVAPKKNLGVSALTPLESGVCKVTAIVTNSGLASGFYVRELGVFAQDPDIGEILYAYTADGSPDYLPAEGGTVAVAAELVVQLAFSNAANITATISMDGLITTAILNTHKNAAVIDHPDNSVTDAKIGNRTVNQALASPGNTGTLTQMLSWITGRLKAMTGKTNWYDAPATTLEAAKAHADAAAPHSGHAPAGFGLGTIAKRVTDFHTITACGFYSGSDALNVPPASSAEWITANVVSIADGALTMLAQSYHPADVGKVWVCSCYGGSWSAWALLETAAGAQAKATAVQDWAKSYGLGSISRDTGALDVNTIVDCGSYLARTGSIHLPTDEYYYIIAEGRFSTNYVSQVAINVNSGTRWARRCVAGVWSDWDNIATMEAVQTAVAAVSTDYVVAQSLGANGYTKWASGKLEQWGVTSSTPGSTARTITLPQPYTTNTYVVTPVTSSGGSANVSYNFFQVTAQTTTTFTAKAAASENTVMSWYAVGN